MRSQISFRKSGKKPPVLSKSFLDWLILATLAVALLASLQIWDSLGLPFPRCWFSETLHLPCPTCGSGRALLALGNFEILTAMHFNPLLVVAIAGLFVMPLALASVKLTPRLRASFTPKRVAAVCAFLILANWIYLVFAY